MLVFGSTCEYYILLVKLIVACVAMFCLIGGGKTPIHWCSFQILHLLINTLMIFSLILVVDKWV